MARVGSEENGGGVAVWAQQVDDAKEIIIATRSRTHIVLGVEPVAPSPRSDARSVVEFIENGRKVTKRFIDSASDIRAVLQQAGCEIPRPGLG